MTKIISQFTHFALDSSKLYHIRLFLVLFHQKIQQQFVTRITSDPTIYLRHLYSTNYYLIYVFSFECVTEIKSVCSRVEQGKTYGL